MIISIFISLLSIVSVPKLDEIRQLYTSASESTQKAKAFYEATQKSTAKDPATQGYKAVATALMAKHTTDKQKRKELFSKGITDLENLISQYPNHYELRLIRLSVQEHTPKALKYNSEIENDARFLRDHFATQDRVLQELVSQYSQQSKILKIK